MSERRIRPATPADIPAITAIYGHSVATETASFEFEPPPQHEMARRMAAFVDAGFPYLVCADGHGTVLGYAYASNWRPRIGYNIPSRIPSTSPEMPNARASAAPCSGP